MKKLLIALLLLPCFCKAQGAVIDEDWTISVYDSDWNCVAYMCPDNRIIVLDSLAAIRSLLNARKVDFLFLEMTSQQPKNKKPAIKKINKKQPENLWGDGLVGGGVVKDPFFHFNKPAIKKAKKKVYFFIGSD